MQKPGVQLINNGCRIREERHYWGGQAEKNSILRAISGGPIYVSNQIGRSRRDLLMPLVLEDGHILRCDRPGMPNVSLILPQENIRTQKKEPQKRSATIRMTVFAFTALYFIDYSSTSMVLSTSTSGSVEYTSASSGASSSSGAASS